MDTINWEGHWSDNDCIPTICHSIRHVMKSSQVIFGGSEKSSAKYLDRYILWVILSTTFFLYVLAFTTFYSFVLEKITFDHLSDRHVVSTTNGKIKGKSVSGYDGQEVFTFLGVPFASPPTGQLRFRRPIPPEPWTNVKAAMKWPPRCPQVFPDFMLDLMLPTTRDMDEDCLYLNIWTPTLNSSARLPVMFYIHGGAFQFGSASQYETDGRIVSSVGNVVVVTINYRLNVFGFLNLDSDSVAGNVGLYDQAMALTWVTENIANFGGDPKAITLWGESSGAISVAAHLVSPVTKNLFHRAILQSGSLFMQEVTFSSVASHSKKFLDVIGCQPSDNSTADEVTDDDNENDDDESETESPKMSKKVASSSPLECLQSKSVKDILKAVGQVNEVNPLSFVISPNEYFLDNLSPKQIRLRLKSILRSDRRLDLLIGFNSDEGSLILNSLDRKLFPRKSKPRTTSGNEWTSESATEYLVKTFSERFEIPTPIIRTGLPSYLSEVADQTTIVKGMSDFVGENVFSCPSVTFADTIVKATSANIYFYEMTGRTSFTSKKFSKWLGTGSLHYEDVPMTFGLPVMNLDGDYEEEDDDDKKLVDILDFRKSRKVKSVNWVKKRINDYSWRESKLSLGLVKAWTNFARVGVPKSDLISMWPPYTDKRPEYLTINATDILIRSNPRGKTCQLFKLALDTL